MANRIVRALALTAASVALAGGTALTAAQSASAAPERGHVAAHHSSKPSCHRHGGHWTRVWHAGYWGRGHRWHAGHWTRVWHPGYRDCRSGGHFR